MGYEFKNWKIFRNQMKTKSIDVVKFEFTYHICNFEVVYSIEQNIFFVAKKGTQIAFSIYLDGYKSSVILEKESYKQLIICKNRVYDENKPYNPSDFLQSLDDKIGTNPMIFQASKEDFYTILKKAIPDEENIYFLGFRPHAIGKHHVTGVNIEKVRKILGHTLAEFCKINNVSVAFSKNPNEKSFDMISNPKKVLDEQND